MRGFSLQHCVGGFFYGYEEKTIFRLITICLFILILSSCSTFSYYLQGARGHIALMSQRRPISTILEDKGISNKRKQQIKQVQSIRKFAVERLKLPQNNSYSTFVELNRSAITWNVIATPRYSVSPIKTCLPIVGCVSYLMYFSKDRALNEVKKHKKLGRDTHIVDSPAYSTGGKFDDPIVSTMFRGGINSIAQIVFHELGHQRLFRKNDSAFNEAFASSIGEQGTLLWLKNYHPKRVVAYEKYLQRKMQFFDLLLTTREELKQFYQINQSDLEKERGKQRIFVKMRLKYKQLKQSWGGDARFDGWFNKHPLNNAKLALVGIYYKKVPEFTKKLKDFNYDFDRFYEFYDKEPH